MSRLQIVKLGQPTGRSMKIHTQPSVQSRLRAPLPKSYHPSPVPPPQWTKVTKDPRAVPSQITQQRWDLLSPSRLSAETRITLLRRMRAEDHPEHFDKFSSGSERDDLALYKWIDGALIQLLFERGLWKPEDCDDDEVKEGKYKVQLLRELKVEEETKILKPAVARYGSEVVNQVLERVPAFKNPPAVIWEVSESSGGGGEVEWMAVDTVEIIFPFLLDCTTESNFEPARRYYEELAINVAREVGGRAFKFT